METKPEEKTITAKEKGATKIEQDLDRLRVELSDSKGIYTSVSLDDGTDVFIRSRKSYFDGEVEIRQDIPSNVMLEFTLNDPNNSESEKYYYGKFGDDEKYGLKKSTPTESRGAEAAPDAAEKIVKAMESIVTARNNAKAKRNLEKLANEAKVRRVEPERQPERRVKIAVDTRGRHHEIKPDNPLYNKK